MPFCAGIPEGSVGKETWHQRQRGKLRCDGKDDGDGINAPGKASGRVGPSGASWKPMAQIRIALPNGMGSARLSLPADDGARCSGTRHLLLRLYKGRPKRPLWSRQELSAPCQPCQPSPRRSHPPTIGFTRKSKRRKGGLKSIAEPATTARYGEEISQLTIIPLPAGKCQSVYMYFGGLLCVDLRAEARPLWLR